MANRNFANAGKIYAMHVKPVLLDCNFVVDSANGNGLGIRSLKGPMIQNVFMHTSASAGKGNTNPATPGILITNPNPVAGLIVVQFQDTYNRTLSGGDSIVNALSGSNITVSTGSSLTVGQVYVITSLGSTTAANWLALGVPAGVPAAVGLPFISKLTSGTGSGTVQASIASGVMRIDSIGDSNTLIAPSISAQGFGAQMILACRDTSGALVAPADGTVISLQFYLSDSSVTVQGE